MGRLPFTGRHALGGDHGGEARHAQLLQSDHIHIRHGNDVALSGLLFDTLGELGQLRRAAQKNQDARALGIGVVAKLSRVVVGA